MVSRAERTPFGEWWWTVDRWLLFSFATLMVAGILFGLAAYPPVANKLGLSTFHFVNRQVFFLVIAGIMMVGTSFLPPRLIRRLALVVFLIGLALVISTLSCWHRDQGCQALDLHRWFQSAALGNREAGLRGDERLGVLASCGAEGSRPAALADRLRAAGPRHRAADPPAGSRADHPCFGGVVGDVLPHRPAYPLGARADGPGALGMFLPIASSTTQRTASTASSTRVMPTPSTPIRLWRASSRVAGSVVAPARAP